MKKTFSMSAAGRLSLHNEKIAYRLFGGYSWMPRLTRRGLFSYQRPMFPDASRLDKLAPSLSGDEKRRIAAQSLSIALDLYVHGIAHRDFHAGNFYYVDGELLLTDFETIGQYTPEAKPAFRDCYDITGKGLDSPYKTGNMGYVSKCPNSLLNVLGVSLDGALNELSAILKRQLRDASLTFHTHKKGRHSCKSKLTYSTFNVPGISISREEAQRDCEKRFNRLGIDSEVLRDKSVLDLGSNVGGMLMEAQRHGPNACIGVEYDPEKVHISSRVASYAQFTNVQFIQKDIDKLLPQHLKRKFDFVFCFAINKHVKYPDRLLRLLGQLAEKGLYFEGNANTDSQKIERGLRQAGFKRVEHIGDCDDDILDENNCRPLFRAWK